MLISAISAISAFNTGYKFVKNIDDAYSRKKRTVEYDSLRTNYNELAEQHEELKNVVKIAIVILVLWYFRHTLSKICKWVLKKLFARNGKKLLPRLQ